LTIKMIKKTSDGLYMQKTVQPQTPYRPSHHKTNMTIILGVSYFKCVHCREITDVAVVANDIGEYTFMYMRPGENSVNKYCRSSERLQKDLEKILKHQPPFSNE
jgi:hypothetical protein